MTLSLFEQFDHVPDGLIDAAPSELLTLLGKPALIHLRGKLAEPLFVSVLLHGNESTGLFAVQRLLEKYRQRELPRSLSIFIGNVQAAASNLRRLDDQPDYNRVWPGTELLESPETQMAVQVFAIMREKKVFASVDVHNNTGVNPHYACVNRLEHNFLHLASLFGRLVVFFQRPKGVQSGAFAELCPAVTLECGRIGQRFGVDHAFEYLERCLHLTAFPHHPIHTRDVDLFHTVAQVKIAGGVSFSFSRSDCDLLLNQDLERLNFTEIAPGTVFGQTRSSGFPIFAQDETGRDVTGRFFGVNNGNLEIARATMPSMLTLDERVIHQDCLCYLMERLHPPFVQEVRSA